MLGYIFITLLVFFIGIIIVTIINLNLNNNNNLGLKKVNTSPRKTNIWIVSGIIATLIGLLMPVVLFLTLGTSSKVSLPTELGAVGDFLGGSMVGFLTLASVLFFTAAIFMQREELVLQRGEFEKSVKEFQISNDSMKKQNIDNTFFNLIKLQNDITQEITYEDVRGRRFFIEFIKGLNKFNLAKVSEYKRGILKKHTNEEIFEMLKEERKNTDDIYTVRAIFSIERLINYYSELIKNQRIHSSQFKDVTQMKKIDLITDHEEMLESYDIMVQEEDNYREKYKVENDELIIKLFIDNYDHFALKYGWKNNFQEKEWYEKIYEAYYDLHEQRISHYYNNLYSIFYFILESDISNKDKRSYLKILIAQLSSAEMESLKFNLQYSTEGIEISNLLKLNDINLFI